MAKSNANRLEVVKCRYIAITITLINRLKHYTPAITLYTYLNYKRQFKTSPMHRSN